MTEQAQTAFLARRASRADSEPWRARLAALAILTAALLGLAVITTPFRIAPLELALLLVVYALFSAVVGAVALAGASLGRIGGFVGALPLAFALLWQLRLQTRFPPERDVFVVAVLLLAVGLSVLLRRLVRTGVAGLARWAAIAAVLSLVFVLVTSAFYATFDTFRWHLLRHNRLVGTPAFFLLADPVDVVQKRVLAAHLDAGLVPETPAPVGSAPAARPDSPNIVYVLLDTLRADSLVAYGGSPEWMPNLNRLAERSAVFGDVMANAGWTRPSVASFFTGLLPELHGAVDRIHMLPPQRVTLAEELQSSGFETAAFVSNFGAVGREAGFAQGFDHFQEVKDPPVAYARAEIMNRAVDGWLSSREKRAGVHAPLFLYLHYLDPHDPYLSGCDGPCPRYWDRDARASYLKQLRHLDTQLQWVIEELPRRLGGHTLLFVTSDHGEEFGEHGGRGHGHSLYREVLHVPALLHQNESSRPHVDARLEGRDFFDLIQQVARDPALDVAAWASQRARPVRYASIDSSSRHAFHDPFSGRIFVRGIERDGLFLIWSAFGETLQLYDRASDPAEFVNLARRRGADVASLSSAMEELVPRWVERIPMDVSTENMEMLRALGYVE